MGERIGESTSEGRDLELTDETGSARLFLLQHCANQMAVTVADELTKYFRRVLRATSTNPIITGTSISGPITAAKAAPLSIPKVATATAIASSKLFDAAVNDSVAHCG